MRTIFVTVLLVAALAGSYWIVDAGTLEPTISPQPTMKTLDEIRPTWHRILVSDDGSPDGCNSSRFRCVLGGQGVLDLETGLVWERAPDSAVVSWRTGVNRCLDKLVGGRAGWRLPSVEELLSMVDPLQPQPSLPHGHPFLNVQPTSDYWSLTAVAEAPGSAYTVHFTPSQYRAGSDKTVARSFWCVRGGSGRESL
jgi:hypothetical protein